MMGIATNLLRKRLKKGVLKSEFFFQVLLTTTFLYSIHCTYTLTASLEVKEVFAFEIVQPIPAKRCALLHWVDKCKDPTRWHRRRSWRLFQRFVFDVGGDQE